MESRLKELYETSDLTLAELAVAVEWPLKRVVNWVNKNYSREFRRTRKKRCYSKSKTGAKNPVFGKRGPETPNYVGRVSDGRGYYMVVKPDWYTGRPGSHHVFEHSVVMCKALGLTEMPKGFVVHHVDGDSKNNSIDNLALLTNSAHSKLHRKMERATTIPQGSSPEKGEARSNPLVADNG